MRALLEELHRLEIGNVAVARRSGLTPPAELRAVIQTYTQTPATLGPDGRVRATVELVFAHAWAPVAARASAVQVAPPTRA